MSFTLPSRLSLVLGALLLFGAPALLAQRGGGHGSGERSHSGHGSHGGYSGYSRSGGRAYYGGHGRSYVAPNRGYYGGGGYYAGRFYPGRGYFYGGGFWARPYFGIGIGIPFGYGYRTNRGCGYVDGWGYFHPAPCYQDYYSGY